MCGLHRITLLAVKFNVTTVYTQTATPDCVQFEVEVRGEFLQCYADYSTHTPQRVYHHPPLPTILLPFPTSHPTILLPFPTSHPTILLPFPTSRPTILLPFPTFRPTPPPQRCSCRLLMITTVVVCLSL